MLPEEPTQGPGDIYRIAGRGDIRVRLLELGCYMRLWMLQLSHVCHRNAQRTVVMENNLIVVIS